MTNFEKYKDQITDFRFAVTKENKPVHCDDINCRDCIFYGPSKSCRVLSWDWLKAEYEEPRINLPKDLSIDAKIEVSNDGKTWYKRYFSRFGSAYVMVWFDGRTSRNAKGEIPWKYARLPKEDENG